MKKASASDIFVYEEHHELTDAKSGEIYLLTYNVAGLPELISSAELPRAESISHIGWKLDRFDLVNIQEDFNYHTNLYQYNKHPFRTETKGEVPFGDGLNTLSKYPIIRLNRVPWKHCHGADCLTPKGFVHMRVQLTRQVFVDIYNLHATAEINTRAVKARCRNMIQLADYIEKHSQDMPLIVMGDFNAYYSFMGDNLGHFIKRTKLLDPWIHLNQNGEIPAPSKDFVTTDKLKITDGIESIDKILYRNSANLQFKPVAYKIESQLFSTEDGWHLSDHLPISVRLGWDYHGTD